MKNFSIGRWVWSLPMIRLLSGKAGPVRGESQQKRVPLCPSRCRFRNTASSRGDFDSAGRLPVTSVDSFPGAGSTPTTFMRRLRRARSSRAATRQKDKGFNPFLQLTRHPFWRHSSPEEIETKLRDRILPVMLRVEPSILSARFKIFDFSTVHMRSRDRC